MTYTEQAASLIAGPNIRAIGGPPWDALLVMLRGLVRQLLDGCAPTPTEGHVYLTERYAWWQVFAPGRRERAIRRAVRQAGGNDNDADKVLAAIEAGKLTPALMAGLYQEAR